MAAAAVFTMSLAFQADSGQSGWVRASWRACQAWKETTMTFMGLEVDAIWVIMIVCIAVVAVSLLGLCRATFLEHRYYKTRGRVRHS